MGNGTQKKRYFLGGGVISNGPMKETSFFTRIILHPRKPTAKALKIGRIPKGTNFHLPTTISQGQAVSFRAGNHFYEDFCRRSINLILLHVLTANCVKTKPKLSPRQRPTQVEVEMSESTGLQPSTAKKTAKRKAFRTMSGSDGCTFIVHSAIFSGSEIYTYCLFLCQVLDQLYQQP